jgi:hypothetical protein
VDDYSERTSPAEPQSTNDRAVPADSIEDDPPFDVDVLRELLREALPFVETYETGEILTEGMSRATYDNLVIRLHMALGSTPGPPSPPRHYYRSSGAGWERIEPPPGVVDDLRRVHPLPDGIIIEQVRDDVTHYGWVPADSDWTPT